MKDIVIAAVITFKGCKILPHKSINCYAGTCHHKPSNWTSWIIFHPLSEPGPYKFTSWYATFPLASPIWSTVLKYSAMIMLLSLKLRMKGFIAGIQYLTESWSKSTDMSDMSHSVSKGVKLFTFEDFLLAFVFPLRSLGTTLLKRLMYMLSIFCMWTESKSSPWSFGLCRCVGCDYKNSEDFVTWTF